VGGQGCLGIEWGVERGVDVDVDDVGGLSIVEDCGAVVDDVGVLILVDLGGFV